MKTEAKWNTSISPGRPHFIWTFSYLSKPDKTQTEIRKVNPISDYDNHIVYVNNTDNWRGWNDNALVHKGAIKELGKGHFSKNLHDIDKNFRYVWDVEGKRFEIGKRLVYVGYVTPAYKDYHIPSWIDVKRVIEKVEKKIPNKAEFDKIKEKLQEVKDDLHKLEQEHIDDIGTVNKDMKELGSRVDLSDFVGKAAVNSHKYLFYKDLHSKSSMIGVDERALVPLWLLKEEIAKVARKVNKLFQYIEIDESNPNNPIRYKRG